MWENGLPPVGTACEYQLEHDEPCDEWSRCTIEFVGDEYIVASCWPNGTTLVLEQCFTKREVKFRPIKPKQQHLRDELIERLCNESSVITVNLAEDIADAIIAEGWTKESVHSTHESLRNQLAFRREHVYLTNLFENVSE